MLYSENYEIFKCLKILKSIESTLLLIIILAVLFPLLTSLFAHLYDFEVMDSCVSQDIWLPKKNFWESLLSCLLIKVWPCLFHAAYSELVGT